MKATTNIPTPTPVTVSLEMSEDDARLLFTILGGSNYQGSDLKPMFDKSSTKNGSIWDESIGIRMFIMLSNQSFIPCKTLV